MHRTYLRRLRKLIDSAVAIGEGHAADHRKAAQAKRAAEESAAPAAGAEGGHE